MVIQEIDGLRVSNWDIVVGCERLTEGCDSCPSYWEYKENGLDYNARYNPSVLLAPLDNPNPTKYTVGIGSDLFHEAVTVENLASVFGVMNQAHWHFFEIATKRAERMYCVSKDFQWGRNISLAVAVESGDYKWRIGYLRKSKAIIKAVSMVPLLGDMGKLDLSGIAIVGVQPETWGLKREMKQSWYDSVKLQCFEQGVIFYENETYLYSHGELKCPERPYQ